VVEVVELLLLVETLANPGSGPGGLELECRISKFNFRWSATTYYAGGGGGGGESPVAGAGGAGGGGAGGVGPGGVGSAGTANTGGGGGGTGESSALVVQAAQES
jgi:hypothetical protein